MTIDDPRYTLAQVAKAAAIKPTLLKNWMDRGVIIADQAGAGPGTRALFSFKTVLHVSLTARLVEMRLSPLRASDIASLWPHMRFGPGPDDDGRGFGGLFGSPFWTVFAFSQDGDDATIQAIDPATTKAAELFAWFVPAIKSGEVVGAGKGLGLVWLNPLRLHAEAVLGAGFDDGE